MFEGYLAMGGVEILNNERSRGYAETTACPLWWFKGPHCATLADFLGDTPADSTLRPGDIDTPSSGYTADGIGTAPWFDPQQPDVSTRFYGAFGIAFKGFQDSTRQAQVTENVTDGGRIGLTRRNTRSVTVQALLTAFGQDALDYGVAWLSAALDPGTCGQHGDTCGTADVQFLADCPPPRQDVQTPGVWATQQANWAVGGGAAIDLPSTPDVLLSTNYAVGLNGYVRTVGGSWTHSIVDGVRRSVCTAQAGYSDAWHLENLGAPQTASSWLQTLPVTPGDVVRARLELRSSRQRSFVGYTRFYDAAGTLLTTTNWGSVATNEDPTAWGVRTTPDAVAPDQAAYVAVWCQSFNAVTNTTDMPTATWYPGEWVEWRNPQIAINEPLPDTFWNGDTPDTDGITYAWSGAVQASTSTKTQDGVSWSVSHPDAKTIRLTDTHGVTDQTDEVASINLTSVDPPTADNALPVIGADIVAVGLRWRGDPSRTIRVGYAWWNEADMLSSGAVSLSPSLPGAGAWVTSTAELPPAPATATGVTLLARGSGDWSASQWIEVTDFIVTKDSAIDGFFDGDSIPSDPDTEAYAWDGDANASTSRYDTRPYIETPEPWRDYYDREAGLLLRYLHDCACISGPLVTDQLQGPGEWCGVMVEFTIVSERPWVFQATRTPALPSTSSTVVQDIPYNLVPYPSAEIRSDTQEVIATNYVTNPSVETGVTGWATTAVDESGAVAAYLTSGQTTDTAIVGTHSYRARVLATGAGVVDLFAGFGPFDLSGLPAGARPNLNLWVANLLAAGVAVTSYDSIQAQAQWLDASGAEVQLDVMGEVDANTGDAFTLRSVIPPDGATQVRLRAAVNGLVYANTTDFRVYADAAAITVP